MDTARLDLTRDQILAHRRQVTALGRRLPPGADSWRRAAWAGLSDSMPRGALLSLHARVEGIGPTAWEQDPLVQVWGPRFSAYAVAGVDRAVFTVGRTPDDPARRALGEELADALEERLQGSAVPVAEAARLIGATHPNQLRYAAPTGRVQIRWDGARQPHVWVVPRPEMEPYDARRELARRFLHILGPGSEEGFGAWAGVRPSSVATTFEALRPELTRVTTPVGERWVLTEDEPALREAGAQDGSTGASTDAPTVRLLPSGDTFFLLHGEDRALLVPDADRRDQLWPSRVWPGALLVDGVLAGTWRRARHVVVVQPWQRLTGPQQRAVEDEASTLPLPGLDRDVRVDWAQD